MKIMNVTETEDKHVYDMIVIGGGPAGYTSALYAVRAGLDTLVLERLSAGGQMATTEQIDNYPGFENGIDGFLLAEKMRKGAERFGAKSKLAEALSLDLKEPVKRVKINEGYLYSKTIVLAMGANPRELGLDAERELVGRGVSYCATCDGMFYRNKRVVAVGGGNSAVEDALTLSRICEKVTLVHRRDKLRAMKIYQDLLMREKNVEYCMDSEVVKLLYDERLKGVRVRNVKSGDTNTIECDGLFISIGRVPETKLVNGKLELDSSGYIVADESTCTSIPGVYAVGDVRTKQVRQIVTATADGAVAVHRAQRYLSGG